MIDIAGLILQGAQINQSKKDTDDVKAAIAEGPREPTEILQPAIKFPAVLVFSNQPANALSDISVDCRRANAVHVAVIVTGTTPSATVSIEGSAAEGGNYLALPDPNASQSAVAANLAFDCMVGSAFVKARIASISGTFATGTGFTVIITPYVAPAQPKTQLLAGSAAIGTTTANQGTAGSAAWPIKVDQTTPGTTDRVTVGGTTVLAATPTLQIAGAYTAKDAVGGKLTFTDATRVSGGTGVIHALTIIDKDSEAAELVLVLFDQDFTATGDADAFDPSDADLANSIGQIKITATDYQAFADNAVAQLRGLGLPFKLTGSANLYGQLMCTGTPTYTAVGDLTVKLHILQD